MACSRAVSLPSEAGAVVATTSVLYPLRQFLGPDFLIIIFRVVLDRFLICSFSHAVSQFLDIFSAEKSSNYLNKTFFFNLTVLKELLLLLMLGFKIEVLHFVVQDSPSS